MPNGLVRRRVFISFCQRDRPEVDQFIYQFATLGKVFAPYVLGVSSNDDFISSTDPEYVMSQIRAKYLRDTTVTIVLLGSCTHSRRYVDWELKTSLRRGTYTPNGVMAIALPSTYDVAFLPPRLEANWCQGHVNCYARFWGYPTSPQELARWIEDAYEARTTRASLIINSAKMMGYNACCRVCGITH